MKNWTKNFLIVLAYLIGFGAGAASAQTGGDGQYAVNTQDVLKIRVGSWDGVNSTYEEWSGLSGNYTVGAAGNISFPYVGTVPVWGVTLDQISNLIAQGLKVKIGLLQLPAVAIEIAEYNPIFVAGDVSRPGEYKFRPGATVRQAIAMAGGVTRGGASGLEIDHSILRSYGQRRFLILSQQRLLLRISRLEAEISNAETFTPPKGIQDKLLDSGLIDLEAEIFENNVETLRQRVLSIDELSRLLNSVIAGLENQLILVREEIALTSEDLENKQRLLKNGTVRASDVTEASRTLSQQRIREIELTVQKLQAEQSLIQAKHEEIDIRKKNMAALLVELDASRTKLSEIALTIETQTDLYTSTLEFAGNALKNATDLPLLISVIGHGATEAANGAATEAETTGGARRGSEQTVLQPGDTVVVRIPASGIDNISNP